jgi:hypothetical protein
VSRKGIGKRRIVIILKNPVKCSDISGNAISLLFSPLFFSSLSLSLLLSLSSPSPLPFLSIYPSSPLFAFSPYLCILSLYLSPSQNLPDDTRVHINDVWHALRLSSRAYRTAQRRVRACAVWVIPQLDQLRLT